MGFHLITNKGWRTILSNRESEIWTWWCSSRRWRQRGYCFLLSNVYWTIASYSVFQQPNASFILIERIKNSNLNTWTVESFQDFITVLSPLCSVFRKEWLNIYTYTCSKSRNVNKNWILSMGEVIQCDIQINIHLRRKLITSHCMDVKKSSVNGLN